MPTPTPSDRRTTMKRTLSLVAGFAIVLLASTAAAQNPALQVARRELLDQAQQARAANDHTRALELAERAAQIQMTPSVRLFIAQEQQSIGRVGEAYANGTLCAREAQMDTTSRQREAVQAACEQLAASLRERIGRITVTVPRPAPAGLRVQVAGQELVEVAWGIPFVVTPGPVTIEAGAEGFARFSRTVNVAAGGNESITIQLTPGAGGSLPPPRVVTGPGSTPPATPAASRGPGPFVLMGIGGAGLIFGGVSAGLFFSARGRCPNSVCPDQATINQAALFGPLMWVGAGVGVAGIVGGVLWYVLGAPRSNNGTARNHIMPYGDGSTAGIVGSF